MSIEGSIEIELSTDGNKVDFVSINSTRPVLASRIFNGKAVTEALKVLPMLFMVCGTAQAVAGVRACEQAMGIQPPGELEQLRENLVSMETVREHLGRVFLDWPVFLGGEPDVASQSQVLVLSRQYRDEFSGNHAPFMPASTSGLDDLTRSVGPVEAILQILETAVFGMPALQWLELDSIDKLSQWAATEATVACGLVTEIARMGWMDSGRCAIPYLPELEPEILAARIDDDFVRAPQWNGECRETSCLTRVHSPLLQELKQRFGNGLVVRITARLTEIARQLVALSLPDGEPFVDARRPGDPTGPGNTGVGQVSAARGQLVHCVRLDAGTVVDYRILAPTEWNFHPRGVVAAGLGALRGDSEAIDHQARLLINSIDPCVDFGLRIT